MDTYFCGCFVNDTTTTVIYTYRHTLSLHDTLPISPAGAAEGCDLSGRAKIAVSLRSTAPTGLKREGHEHRRSEEHTSELQSLMRISYAVFCLKKKNDTSTRNNSYNNLNSST